MAVGRIIAGGALLASLAACDAPGTRDVTAQVAEFCRPSSMALAEPLDPVSPRDAAVAARFGKVCSLSKLKGLRFIPDAEVYECRLSLPRYDTVFLEKHGERFVRESREAVRTSGHMDEQAFEKSVEQWKADLKAPDERLKAAFGFSLSLGDFNSAAREADDLIEAAYETTKDEPGLGLPLAIMSQYSGADISILLVTQQGKFFDYVWSRESLKAQLREVASLEGAANLIYLKKELGFVIDAASDKRAMPLCEAGDATADAEGWTFEGVNFVKNCSPGDIRDIRVTQNGEIDAVTTGTTNPSACYD